MRVSAIIEARMGSTRFPAKTMVPINGEPMLAYVAARCSMAQLIDTLVVTTPDTKDNAAIWEWAHKNKDNVRLVVGPENDVLERVLKAADETKTDVLVEITADCPCIDPGIIDLCAGYFISGDWDLVGNCSPSTWPLGQSVRVFSRETLRRCNELVRGDEREAFWREHVSPYIYRSGSQFSSFNLEAPPEDTYPEFRMTVDTPEDMRVVTTLLKDLFPGNARFTVHDALQYLAGLPGYDLLTQPRKEIPAVWSPSLSPEVRDLSDLTLLGN